MPRAPSSSTDGASAYERADTEQEQRPRLRHCGARPERRDAGTHRPAAKDGSGPRAGHGLVEPSGGVAVLDRQPIQDRPRGVLENKLDPVVESAGRVSDQYERAGVQVGDLAPRADANNARPRRAEPVRRRRRVAEEEGVAGEIDGVGACVEELDELVYGGNRAGSRKGIETEAVAARVFGVVRLRIGHDLADEDGFGARGGRRDGEEEECE